MEETKTIKVLIVDDSQLYRKTLERIFEHYPDVKIIGTAVNGSDAINFLQENELPDLITLDVEMPEMDGLQTLEEINKLVFEKKILRMPIVLMISTLTHEGGTATINALQRGAYDFITKPNENDNESNLRVLIRKIDKRLKMIRKKIKGDCQGDCIKTGMANPQKSAPIQAVRLAIAVGCAAGGLKSLFQLLPNLCKIIHLPVFLTTALPHDFLLPLIENLNEQCFNKLKIAKDNETVQANNVYIAPPGKHLIIRNVNNVLKTGILDSPPENNAKPSFDVLLRSMHYIYGGSFITVFLAGSTTDGVSSIMRMKKQGALVLAQDHTDSGICDMPASAIASGGVDKILPIEEIPTFIAGSLVNN